MKYTDRFVGADPRNGPSTTTISTLIMPLRLDFGGGVVLDAAQDFVEGRTPVEWVTHSPFFVPTPFNAGTVSLGTTQWSDALLRANFWNEGGSQPNYHLRLVPTVLPAETMVVPPDKGSVEAQAIDVDWLSDQINAALSRLNPDPAALVIIVVAHDIWLDGAFGGFHDSVALASRPDGPVQTYVVESGIQSGVFDPGAGVGVVLAHELSEWMNDPFIENPTPPWTVFESRCQDNLETGDFMDYRPASFFQVTTSEGLDYKVEDQLFFDWFTRRASRSVNGWYSFHGSETTYSDSCYDTQRFAIQSLDIPGEFGTLLTNINGRGDMVGNYYDAGGAPHGVMLLNWGAKLQTIDMPAAFETFPSGINNDGLVVGTYIGADGSLHGFTWQNGTFRTIDPLAGYGTVLDAISDNGDIVGGFFPSSGSVESGLLIRGGVAQSVMPSFATDAEVTAVSASGQLAGYYGVHGDGSLDSAFVGVPGNFAPVPYGGPSPAAVVTLPAGITDRGTLVGTVVDVGGAVNGFFKTNQDWQRIGYGGLTFILGLNTHDVAVGYYYDDAAHRLRGMIVRERGRQ